MSNALLSAQMTQELAQRVVAVEHSKKDEISLIKQQVTKAGGFEDVEDATS